MRKLSFVSVAMLIIFLATSMVVSAGAKSKDTNKGISFAQKAWADDTLFQKLSGAAQQILIVKYGPRPGKRENRSAAGKVKPGPVAPVAAPPNVLVNDPTLDLTAQNTQSETTVVAGSGTNIVAGYNDSGSFTGPLHFTGYSTSSDGGATWTDRGTLPASAEGDAGDPVIARHVASGAHYFATLGFATFENLQCFKSTDDGVTWSAPVNCTPGFGGTGDFQDKEWITVDNTGGANDGNVYVAWRNFSGPATAGIRFTRSTDGGATFGPSGGLLIASEGSWNVQGAFVTVGPDGAVYVAWLDQSAGFGTPNIVMAKKSTDGGVTFGAASTIATLANTGINGDLGLAGGYRSNGFPHVEVIQSGTFANEVNFVWNDGSTGATTIDIAQCPLGDITSCVPFPGLDAGAPNEQYMPTIAISPDGTKLFWTWYDTRHDPGMIQRWGVYLDAGIGFSPNFRISDGSWPPVFGQDPVVNSVYMGDYDQAYATNTDFHLTWGDNRLGTQDVRYADVPDTGPGAVLGAGNFTVSGGNGNGRIDFNECNDVTIDLFNDGNATATGISAVLSTSTPEVSVTQPNATYPDLAPGGTGTNTPPFQVSTTPAFVCGTVIDFTLTVTSSDGTDVFTFNIDTSTNYTITTGAAAIDPGTTDIGSNCDDCTVAIALPFPVTFYGTSYASVNASSNGNLQFVSDNAAFTNACLPTTSKDTLISPYWDDLRTDINGPDGIFTSTVGSAPNRIFNIEWRAVRFDDNSQVENFEVRLFEGSDHIEFVYGTSDNAGNSATVGIQNDTGSAFVEHTCNGGGITPGLLLNFDLIPCLDGGGVCPVAACSVYQTGFDGPFDWELIKAACDNIASNLECDPLARKAWSNVPTVVPNVAIADVTTNMLNTSNDDDSKMWLYTNQIDKKNRIEIKFLMFRDKVVLIDKFGGVRRGKVKADVVLDPNVFYLVETTYDGATYTVSINGVPVISYPIAGLQAGDQGIAGKGANTVVRASDFCVD